MNRLFAIGDIHGCSIALDALMNEIDPGPDDTVVTLGDYVDRGPDSAGVIDLLITWRDRTRLCPILGNHEEMMLDVIRGDLQYGEWLRHGGVDTLESYEFDGSLDFLPENHQTFFEQCGDYFETEDYIFTHAGYDPDRSLDQQSIAALRWRSLRSGVPAPHHSGKTAVVGHTANEEGDVLDYGHLICVDTYCYGGAWLTAFELHSRQVVQSNQNGDVRKS